MTRFYIDLACNYPNNGDFTGYVDQIQVRPDDTFDSLLQLYGNRLSLRKFYSKESKKPREIKIGHIVLRIGGYATWVGNWCWDRVSTDADSVVLLLAYLQRRGWQCEMGICELFEKFNAKESITVEDLTKGAL